MLRQRKGGRGWRWDDAIPQIPEIPENTQLWRLRKWGCSRRGR